MNDEGVKMEIENENEEWAWSSLRQWIRYMWYKGAALDRRE